MNRLELDLENTLRTVELERDRAAELDQNFAKERALLLSAEKQNRKIENEMQGQNEQIKVLKNKVILIFFFSKPFLSFSWLVFPRLWA